MAGKNRQINYWPKFGIRHVFYAKSSQNPGMAQRKIVLSAGKSIFHCLISTFHAMKHTNKSLKFTFHTMKYSH